MENNHNNPNDTQQKDNRRTRPSFGFPTCTPGAETTCGEPYPTPHWFEGEWCYDLCVRQLGHEGKHETSALVGRKRW